MQNEKSALGLDGNVAALLGYVIWIVALISIFIEKDNKFVRFHAIQAIIYWAAALVIYIGLFFVMAFLTFLSGALASLFSLLIFLFGIAVFAGIIFLAVKSFQGELVKFPVIGEMAEEWSKK